MASKILYLSYDGLTDPLGQSQILPYLTNLSSRGYSITIISAEKQDNFGKRKKLIEQIVQQHNLQWKPVFYTKKPPVFSTLWDIRKMQQLASQLHKQQQFQIVHCRSYITALVGLSLKRKLGLKFIFDMRGFWADERIEGGLWNLKNPVFKTVYKYFKRKETEFLQQADYTVSLTHQAKDEIHSWPGLQTVPIQVIPCCVDTALFENSYQPSVISHLLSAADTPDASFQASTSNFQLPTSNFTISYLGSLGTWYMLEEMLQFFKRLLLQKPEATFLFITPDNRQTILDKAQLLGIPASRLIIQKAERREVPLLLAKSQVSIFFIKPSFSKKASSPTKMGEILSMGIPIICNAGVGDTDYLFNKYQSGYLLHALNNEAYDKAILEIDSLLKIPGADLRKIALAYFDLRKGVDLYEEVYEHVLKENPGNDA